MTDWPQRRRVRLNPKSARRAGVSGACAVVAPVSAASTGERIRRGAITKVGNAGLRIVIEAARAYRHQPIVCATLWKCHASLDDEEKAIAWNAQHHLRARYRALSARSKTKQ